MTTQSPVSKLKNRIFGRSKDLSATLKLISMAKEFHCVPELLGRDYEVRDADDNITHRIRQKSMPLNQVNELMKVYNEIKKLEKQQLKEASRGKKK